MQGLLSTKTITGDDKPSHPCQSSNNDGRAHKNNNYNSNNKFIGRRRKLKSTLYFAWSTATLLVIIVVTSSSMLFPVNAFSSNHRNRPLSQRKNEWIQKSIQYYSTVMRKDRIRPSNGSTTATSPSSTEMDSSTSLSHTTPQSIIETSSYENKEFVDLATKHYYARHLVKKGKLKNAEILYRKIIAELSADEDEDHDCDHTKLAVSTLLLALHMQRMGDIKATRSVFLNFFRRVAIAQENIDDDHKCACSARVLQAYALFEMKNGFSNKSLEIIQKAVKMDENLKPVLGWKQFRDADAASRARKSKR